MRKKIARAILEIEAVGFKLHALTDFKTVLDEAERLGQFGPADKKILQDWLVEPWGWAERQGLK